MSRQLFPLIDFDTQIKHDEFSLSAVEGLQLAGSPDWYVRLQTLQGGESQGVVVVELCNGPLSLVVMPTKGMSIWKGRYRNLPLEWISPVRRPVHPQFVNLHDRGGLGWLNSFNELCVRCGLGFNGPPGNDDGCHVTLHGRIGHLAAHQLLLEVETAGDGSLTLRGVIDETSMFGACFRLTSTIRMQAGTNQVELLDEIENIGGTAEHLSLLYHINLGQPFLEAGGGNVVACSEMAPRDARSAEGIGDHDIYQGPDSAYTEQAYYYRPQTDANGWSRAVLHNAAQTAAFSVLYDARQLPCFVVWKNTQSLAQGYVTGLEPAVNFPNFRGYERAQNRLPVLQPGEKYTTHMFWEIADTTELVAAQIDQVKSLQERCQPLVHETPQPGWSPAGDSRN